jgi:hypothetical protein
VLARVRRRVGSLPAVIGSDAGGIETRELQTAVTIGRAHHGDLDTLVAHTGHTAGPFAFDGHPPFQGQAEFGEEDDGGIEVFHHDADVLHADDSHASTSLSVGAVPR